MFHFTKFATAAVLVTSLAPFAAQARSGALNVNAPAAHTVQTAQNNAANTKYAMNDIPVALRHLGGAATDSYGG